MTNMTKKQIQQVVKTKKYKRRYPKLIREMMHYDSIEDFEGAHIKEKDTYELFINDIVGEKYNTIEEVKQVARQLKLEVIEYSKDKTRWYA